MQMDWSRKRMKCDKCHHKSTRVIDSRPIEDNEAIRRRRQCENCGFRFTTFERREETPLIVVKKDGTRQEFVRKKLIRGLMRACEKRPVRIETIEEIALDVEQQIRNSERPEIDSHQIGEMVLEHLLEIDDVAYVRFASVYRQFKNTDVFLEQLKELLQKDKSED